MVNEWRRIQKNNYIYYIANVATLQLYNPLPWDMKFTVLVASSILSLVCIYFVAKDSITYMPKIGAMKWTKQVINLIVYTCYMLIVILIASLLLQNKLHLSNCLSEMKDDDCYALF